MAEIQITNPITSGGGGGTVNDGVLQIQGGGPITNSSQVITDQLGNTSPLYISSTALTITTPSSASAITRVIIQGSTDDAGYILRAVNRTGTEIFNIKDDGSVLSTGPLTVSTIANATTDTDRFLVSDNGTLKYRTGAELLSDLGIAGAFVSGAGTATRLAYWSGTVGDSSSALTSSANLFWDAANSRLGINTATPTQAIDVTGTTKTTSLILSTATAQATTATQYLSLDAADSTVKYRTPAQVLSDIGAQAIITNPVTGTGAATRVAFWASGSAISSSSALNWDNTNGRLGIGTASPGAQLQVTGNALAGNNLARFETQGNVNLFTLSEQGFITAFAPQVNPLSGTTEINKFTSSFAAGSAGSGSFRAFTIAYTISNTGAQTGTATGIFLNAAETPLVGMTHNLMDLQVGGTSRVTATRLGFFISDASSFYSTSRFRISPDSSTGADGNIIISNTGLTSFGLLKLGGTTSAFPAIARSSSNIIVTLADATAGASLGVGMASATGVLATAALQIDSTTKGFLLPRMTTTQRDNITTPANGLMVYDTDLGQPCFYDTVSARWNKISHSAA